MQVVGIPVADEHAAYLEDVAAQLKSHGVRVEVDSSDEALRLRVVNDVARSWHGLHGAGIGMANVRERLAVQFGERASFTAGPAEGDVWIAEIRMPLLRDGPTS